jgi:hypothetical protein
VCGQCVDQCDEGLTDCVKPCTVQLPRTVYCLVCCATCALVLMLLKCLAVPLDWCILKGLARPAELFVTACADGLNLCVPAASVACVLLRARLSARE